MKGWMWPAEMLGQCPERAPSLPGSGEAGLGVPAPLPRATGAGWLCKAR